ncbi:MAG: hypothetical protein ABNH02_05600 [Pseudomonadales bacterium]|jgi:hypothetical protein
MAKKKSKVTEDKSANDAKYDGSGELRTMTSNRSVREQLSDDIAKFLQSGGEIVEVEKNLMADPPQKPASSYGSRPI